MRFDLHTHSSCSDGVLSPEALVQHAAALGVQLLALTDHDTLAGCARAAAAAQSLGLQFVTGVEMSCGWRGQSIHVIGLDVRADAPALRRQVTDVLQHRRERIAAIGERLQRRARLPVADLISELLASEATPTRMHVARALVRAGVVDRTQTAFDRWLGQNRPGHVPMQWPTLAQTISCLHAADAQVVLAHPHRYRLSAGALRGLLAEFTDCGGHGVEISIGGMGPTDRDRMATLARRHGLAGSGGSDFHDPAVPWNPPGRFAKLPDDIEPIAARLATPGPLPTALAT